MALTHKFDQTKFAERKTRLDAARNAVTRLLQIEENIDGATVAQSKTAIKDIAIYERHLIRIVAGELV